ncbi:hypothetical protein F5Y17DRAFT_180120 [Xylariaceae sp. FL0594]|nr:hypothetical protein F5Y17DRAFT_180120 [Xylariaceae sp. FL0594]
MAPVSPNVHVRMGVVPRSNALSSGAIAGAVIGSVLGGFFLLIVIGFLYFRYRRRFRTFPEEDALDISKAPDHTQNVPYYYYPHGLPDPTLSPDNGQPPLTTHVGALPYVPDQSDVQASPVSPHDGNWTRNDGHSLPQAAPFDSLPVDINFSLPPRQQTFQSSAELTASPLDHASTVPGAANSSYYDPRISLSSDPAQESLRPTRQMSDLYEAQKREAEAHRRNSSLTRRVWRSITRRQSSRTSKGTAIGSSRQQSEGPSTTGSTVVKREPGGQELTQRFGTEGFSIPLTAEPETIPESPGDQVHDIAVGSGRRAAPRLQTLQGPYGLPRQDSQNFWSPVHRESTIRPTTETDPELPSSVLGRGSAYGLPLVAQPPSPSLRAERLNSPGIPDMMDVDVAQVQADEQSPFRSSHSPPLPAESFTINPMAIWHPATAAEQAAYTTYQIEHSASPPAIPPPPPEVAAQQSTAEDVVDSEPPKKEEDLTDMYLILPADDDENNAADGGAGVDSNADVNADVDAYRQSSDSYDFTTTPGQSPTSAESNGRTPETRTTVSPSPFPTIPEQGKLAVEASMSPGSSRPSPQSGPLVCPECGREFDQIHKLNHHKRYHYRNHECTYPNCDRKFGTKTHLDRHINDRHLKLKTYHCTDPSCAWFKGGKSFPRKDNWRRHMLKKHGTTPQDFEYMEMSLG